MIRRCINLLILLGYANALSLHPVPPNPMINSITKFDAKININRRDLIFKYCIGTTTTATIITGLSFITPHAAYAMYENGPSIQSSPIKIGDTGVTYQDLRNGDGDIIEEGKRVNIQWVLKRSNGYDIDSSSNNDGVPFIFIVGNDGSEGTPTKNNNNYNRAIPGLDLGVRGMKVGGIRRIVIPPNMAYVEGVEDGKPGPVPTGFGPKQRIRRVMELLKDVPGESIVLDVKATLVK